MTSVPKRLARLRLLAAAATAAAAALGIVQPVHAALQAGEAAPDFNATASLAGKAFSYSLADALRKGPVVVYFYPAAFTGGCNIQAHSFAENADNFGRAGASIIGISLDDISRLNAFSADPQSCAGKFPVASDAGGRIARAYDLTVTAARPGHKDTRGQAIAHDRAERTTFIITSDGRIAASVGGVSPEANVHKALEIVRSLPAATKRSP